MPTESEKIVSCADVYPHTRETKGGVVAVDHQENLKWLLDHFNPIIRHNQMTRRREILIPGLKFFEDDEDNNALSRIESIAVLNGLKEKNVEKFLDIIAAENFYHPITYALSENKWDGKERLNDFLSTIESTNPDHDKFIILTWMTAAIAAIHTPGGFTNHGVLVLQGKQGIGKTAWIKKLDPINCGAVATGVLLDPKNKDSIIGSNRFWIVEIGELDATFSRSHIGQLKSFLTSAVDNVRVPWGKRETTLVRRTAYAATVNDSKFLIDNTGNRRWWTIEAINIDYEHDFNMLQVWAEVYQGWLKGALTYMPLEQQKIIDEKNFEHEKTDPLKDKVLDYYDWVPDWRKHNTCILTSSQVLEEIGYRNPTVSQATRMGVILIELTGKKPDRRKHTLPRRLLSHLGD